MSNVTREEEYANRLVGGIDSAKLKQQVQEERDKVVAEFQKASFPIDPVLLYELQITSVDGRVDVYYAITQDNLLNPERSQELLFFDVIQGDGITEMAFINVSITLRKIVFCNIEEIRSTTLYVYDQEMAAFRASKVLRGLPGISKKS